MIKDDTWRCWRSRCWGLNRRHHGCHHLRCQNRRLDRRRDRCYCRCRLLLCCLSRYVSRRLHRDCCRLLLSGQSRCWGGCLYRRGCWRPAPCRCRRLCGFGCRRRRLCWDRCRRGDRRRRRRLNRRLGGWCRNRRSCLPCAEKYPQPSILHQSLHAMVNFWRLTHR